MNLSSNESRASLELDQWEWRTLTCLAGAGAGPGSDCSAGPLISGTRGWTTPGTMKLNILHFFFPARCKLEYYQIFTPESIAIRPEVSLHLVRGVLTNRLLRFGNNQRVKLEYYDNMTFQRGLTSLTASPNFSSLSSVQGTERPMLAFTASFTLTSWSLLMGTWNNNSFLSSNIQWL